MDIDAVTRILDEAAETEILPRFRSLSETDVMEKAPGDVVTVADRRSEELITKRLREIVDAPVVGEEAAFDDPALLSVLREAPMAWLVDPVDGTANFVAGSSRFAVMAALVKDGQTVASWIVQPKLGHTYVAELGGGAWRDGVRLRRDVAPEDPAKLRGDAPTRSLDESTKEFVTQASSSFAVVGSATKCAGVDYPRLAEGERDFIFFPRTLPWDHAPGGLLIAEAGGHARRLDGSPYRPGTTTGGGLLAASDEQCWTTVRRTLLPR